MWPVRSAAPSDRATVVALVRAAFTSPGHDGEDEVGIVEETWRRAASIGGLELVATDRGAVIGYALGARAELDGATVVGVAPVAVAPARQGQGVGTDVMTELVARADRQGWPAVVLLGDARFYGRFGFEPASGAGIWYEPVGPEDPHFLVRRLRAFDPARRGRVRYCWETPG